MLSVGLLTPNRSPASLFSVVRRASPISTASLRLPSRSNVRLVPKRWVWLLP